MENEKKMVNNKMFDLKREFKFIMFV